MLHNELTPETSVTEISGVGAKRAEQLKKLGIKTLRDLVFHFPRAYENRGDISKLGDLNLNVNKGYILKVASEVKSAKIRTGMTISKFRAFDESGSCEVVFFNSPFIKDIFHIGCEFRFYGKTAFTKKNTLSLVNPKYEPIIDGVELDSYFPIYPLTQGLSEKTLEKLIKSAINDILPHMEDPLPDEIRVARNLCTQTYAIKNIHFPENAEELKRASKRLAYDEMFLFALSITLSAHKRDLSEGVSFSPCSLEPFLKLLPYELTNSQKKAINDIYNDTVLKRKNGKTPCMARILVGDVGCGKTVCASASMYIAVKSDFQCALMVPTEILAFQHYVEMKELFSKLGYKVELLTGSTKLSEKRRIYKELESGGINILIGTHALITDKVIFKNLGLIITDEQHRFGVNQRGVLKSKEKNAHVLVMSATPIPRTLALTLYGDLDISRITEMPKGRLKVDTFVVDESYRQRLNNFIRKQVSLGGQCYIVCPSIEKNEDNTDDGISFSSIINGYEEEKTELKNVIEYSQKLQEDLPEIKIEYLHGKMKSNEKDAIMERFSKAETQVLVSTTVIEVGVNVPNASLMIVENADRFGLSQLHQLRGRVGRGTRKSYCILVSDSKSPKSKSRLEVMHTTSDGYEIAEKDLILRGPGDFFSHNSSENMRQSGGFEFKMSSMVDSENLLDEAFSDAKTILLDDPTLSHEQNRNIKSAVQLIVAPSSTIS